MIEMDTMKTVSKMNQDEMLNVIVKGWHDEVVRLAKKVNIAANPVVAGLLTTNKWNAVRMALATNNTITPDLALDMAVEAMVLFNHSEIDSDRYMASSIMLDLAVNDGTTEYVLKELTKSSHEATVELAKEVLERRFSK